MTSSSYAYRFYFNPEEVVSSVDSNRFYGFSLRWLYVALYGSGGGNPANVERCQMGGLLWDLCLDCLHEKMYARHASNHIRGYQKHAHRRHRD